MVVVDTSVWIDFFQHPESPWASRLAELIEGHNCVALCGIVLQEILQGIKHPASCERTRERLCRFPFVAATKETHVLAADLYRNLRLRGITVPSTDAAVAAIAIANRMEMLTKDQHFAVIASHSELKLHRIGLPLHQR
jgi:predicted nucleic acid-binding protein